MFNRIKSIDWRIFLGIVVTLAWFAAGVIYLRGGSFSNVTIYDIPLENVGSFLEGAFAPLAFLWLVIGLFIQQKELADNTAVLREATAYSEKQTQAIAATELNARQETYFKIAESVSRQLGNIAGMLFVSNMGSTEGNPIPAEELREYWYRLSTGDSEVFSRQFLMLDADQFGGYEKLFYATEIRQRHTVNFIDRFDRLYALASNCDSAGLITGSLTHTGHGLLYNAMKRHAPSGFQLEATDFVNASHFAKVMEQSQDSDDCQGER